MGAPNPKDRDPTEFLRTTSVSATPQARVTFRPGCSLCMCVDTRTCDRTCFRASGVIREY